METGVFESLLRENPVIPVAVFSNQDDAVRTANLLLENGIPVVEVTLRTPEAYGCIEAIRKQVPSITVGAGSILTPAELVQAREAGAVFGVAPSLHNEVVARAVSLAFPFVPGVATASELHLALERTPVVKIFPAAQLGGPAFIKAISAPFRKMSFTLMPTGGVTIENLKQYLEIDTVIACGLSQIVDQAMIDRKDWGGLDARMKEAMAIAGSLRGK